jgi:hypothetical protein
VVGKGGGGGRGGEMTQALYAHINNKTIKIKKESFTLRLIKDELENMSPILINLAQIK